MNSIETEECNQLLGTSNDVSMDDYFTTLSKMIGVDIDILKSEFKSSYPDTTDWSFLNAYCNL